MTDEELIALRRLLNAVAGEEWYPPSWRHWFSNAAEQLGVEMANREIAAALDRDPAGYLWFGRLRPPS